MSELKMRRCCETPVGPAPHEPGCWNDPGPTPPRPAEMSESDPPTNDEPPAASRGLTTGGVA